MTTNVYFCKSNTMPMSEDRKNNIKSEDLYLEPLQYLTLENTKYYFGRIMNMMQPKMKFLKTKLYNILIMGLSARMRSCNIVLYLMMHTNPFWNAILLCLPDMRG